LEAENQPIEMILMLQKEVSQRICAKPPNMSLLAVSVQFYAEPKIISHVSKGSFWPSPKVDSAIIKITPKNRFPLSQRGIKGDFTNSQNPPHPSFSKEGAINFFQVVHAGFSAPRKQLAGNLTKNLKIDRQIILQTLQKSDIEPAQRAETLCVDDWKKLTKFLAPYL
jgi:16S rRNA (adenine1518-N6/adenine1519-N6)-dimethyltransferase